MRNLLYIFYLFLAFVVIPQIYAQTITLPYSQSFNTTSWPAFFSQSFSGTITSNRWGVSNSHVAGGSPYEVFAKFVEGVGVSRLILGAINTTGISNINLSFRQYFEDFAAGITYKIQTSPDGITWTNQPFNFSSGNGNVGPEVVYTSVNVSGNTNYIAWVLDGDHNQFNYWIIDDINISRQLNNDAATTSIILASPLPTGVITPKATVINMGVAANTFNVQMTITGGYISTRSVTLSSGASQQVAFDNWTAAGGAYTVNVCTQLGTDQNTSNDCMNKVVSVIAGWTHNAIFPDFVYFGSGAGYVSGGVSYIFSIGGNTTSALGTACYKFNVNTNTWSSIAPLPSGRRVLATAVVGDYLYAIAGSDVNDVYQSTVFRYSITGNSWSTVASLPTAIAWGKAVGYNNKIYFAGGQNRATPLATIYVYDVAGNSWASADSMPASRFGGAFSIVGNKLVYVGGSGYNGISNSVFVGTISSVNPLSISWMTAANKYPGIGREISYSNTNYSQQVKNKTRGNLFSDKTSIYPGGVMYRFDGAPWGADGMIVAGGSPTADLIPASPNPCYVYKPGTDTWTQQGEVPTAVFGSSLGTVNNGSLWKLVVVSGLGLNNNVTNLTQIYSAELGSNFQVSVNVNSGWNMVSIPGLHPANQNVSTWWPFKVSNSSVFQFSGYYQIVTTATPGKGYWMSNSDTRTYNTGDEWPAGGITIVPNNPIPAAANWNMIGCYNYNVAVSGITTSAGTILGSLFGYSGGYNLATTLVPGYGYWIRLSQAANIILPNASFKETVEAVTIDDKWGKIILTDNAGRNYTLYAAGGQTDLSQFDMPPAPPAGMMDVRYSSQRFVENLNEGFQGVDFNGMEYPVTVRVENMSIKLQDQSGKVVNTVLRPGEKVTIGSSEISKLMVSADVIPVEYSLSQNYPNPFNPSTLIQFTLPEDVNNMSLIVYNALGQKVAELINGSMQAGYHQYKWNASNLTSGIYIYQLRTEKFLSTKKMMLLK